VSPIGQLTGLEPVLVYNQWFPDENSNPETRPGIKGFYLLTSIPGITFGESNLGQSLFSPVEFHEDSEQAFTKCLGECLQHWSIDTPECISWKAWSESVCPKTNAADYVAKHRLYVPLEAFFFKDRKNEILKWNLDICRLTFNNDAFKVPSCIGISTASVTSRFNTNPPNPRLYVELDERVIQNIQRFNIRTAPYYASLERNCNNPKLQEMIRFRVSPNGTITSTSGFPKNKLITTIKQDDIAFISTCYRQLIHTEFFKTNETLNEFHPTAEDYQKTIASLKIGPRKDIKLKIKDFQQLQPGRIIGDVLMDFVMNMYLQLDKKYSAAYDSVNSKYK